MKLSDTFSRLVREEFAFLVGELGFDYEKTELHVPEVWTVFKRKDTAVTVIWEVGAAPWVEISFPHPVPSFPGERVRTSLGKLVALTAPDTNINLRPVEHIDDPALLDILRESASLLRQLGTSLLQGEPSVRSRLSAR